MGMNATGEIDALLQAIAVKKDRLDRLRPTRSAALSGLEHTHDLEIAFTSNSLAGNALSPEQSAQVIEQGVTICGKPLKDHMEALDLYDAMRYARERARTPARLTETGLANLHRLVLRRSRPDLAGQYAPEPPEIPFLMGDFAAWLGKTLDTPATAFAAHRRLSEIHPFHDGNGRTARLLMNLMLLRGGYPPIAIQQDSEEYLYQRLDATLDRYLSALELAS